MPRWHQRYSLARTASIHAGSSRSTVPSNIINDVSDIKCTSNVIDASAERSIAKSTIGCETPELISVASELYSSSRTSFYINGLSTDLSNPKRPESYSYQAIQTGHKPGQ